MKKGLVLPGIILVSLVFSAFTVAEDIITRLGMAHKSAQEYIASNLTNSFTLPRLKVLPEIVSGDKVGATKELCSYIKLYANSEEFSTAYNVMRDKRRPTSEPEPIDDETLKMTKEAVQSMESELAVLKKDPKTNKQNIESYEMMLEPHRANLAAWADPTPNKTKWEKEFPVDPTVLVKASLQNYLKLVATVDFNAKLTAPDNYNRKKFVNPSYEKMPSEWKACFRAGKEVNGVVTSFVKEWLKGEIISSVKTKMPATATEANTSKISGTAGSVPEGSDDANVATNNDNTDKSAKPKKSLLGKVKDKAKSVINN